MLPWPEVPLLSSSKQHRIQRCSGSGAVHIQSTDPRPVELETSQNLSISPDSFVTPNQDILESRFLTLCPTMVR